MAFLGSILRSRRGDFNLFLIAALVALLVVPGAAHASLPPQSCEVVLFWLQNETAATAVLPVAAPSSLLALTHQNAASQSQNPSANRAPCVFSTATAHCGQHLARPSLVSPFEPQFAPQTLVLERHVVARLSGVRTNRRLI